MRMRSLALALLLALAAAGTAGAQVAAPRLTPLFMGINEVNSVFNPALDPVNPAAQMWAGSSIVGAGASTQGQYRAVNSVAGTVLQEGDANASVAQLRIVGDFAAFSAMQSKAKWSATNPVPPPDLRFETIDTRLELALRYADWLALGVASQASRERTQIFPVPPPPPDEDMRRTQLQLPGASIHFGSLYFGYAAGSQEMRIESAAGVPGLIGATERDRRRVTRTGMGLYNRSDTWSYHVELYRETREGFQLPLSFPGKLLDQMHLSGATVELVVHGLLVGFEKSTSDNHEPILGPPVFPVDFTSSYARLSLGWVPKSGFTAVVTGQRARRLTGFAVGQLETLLVSLGWAF